MNVFAPYTIIEQKPKYLHLELPKWRRRMNYIFFRIFPFVLISLLVGVIVTAKELPTTLLYTLVIGVIIISIMLFFKSYPSTITITEKSITILQKRVAGTSEIIIPLDEIEKITYVVLHGKSGGTYFKIRKKSGTKIKLFDIPVLIMKKENTDQIVETIYAITGLKAEKK